MRPESPRRIWVIGCPGSGKSTLARTLGSTLDLPVHELDGIFHQANWQQLPDDEFLAQVTEITSGDRWVLDGNYFIRTGNQPRERVELVVWPDLPRLTNLQRVARRTFRRILHREELWNGNKESWRGLVATKPADNIILWTWMQHPVYRKRYGAAIAAGEFGDARVVRLRSQDAIDEFVTGLTA